MINLKTNYVLSQEANNPVNLLSNNGESEMNMPDSEMGSQPVSGFPLNGEGGMAAPRQNANEAVNLLPNPGEGGPIYQGWEGGIPTPDQSANEPVNLLPNPGEGGPIDQGWGGSISGGQLIPSIIGTIISSHPRPTVPCRFCSQPGSASGSVRFLNAASGYNPFTVYVDNQLFATDFSFGEMTEYEKVANGYRIITVMGENQYIYLQKSILVPRDETITIAICNSQTGMDLFVISDAECNVGGAYGSCIRTCNLSYSSGPLNVVIGNNDVVFRNIAFEEATGYKMIWPGDYVYYVTKGVRNILVSSNIAIKPNVSYTIYLLNWNRYAADSVRVLVVEEH